MPNHIVCRHEMSLPASPQVLFPLLCPVREAEWLPGWSAQLVHSDSGFAEAGCVFTTPGDGPEPWTWVIARHDAVEGRIRFIVTVPGSHVRVLDIDVQASPAGCTATWTYTLTALTEAGEAFLPSFAVEFPARMTRLETLLTDFLHTGSMAEAASAQA